LELENEPEGLEKLNFEEFLWGLFFLFSVCRFVWSKCESL
jgi:hypothetical protein